MAHSTLPKLNPDHSQRFGLIILGNSGVGKSFLANLFLSNEKFVHKAKPVAVTIFTEYEEYTVGSITYVIFNIPGLFESKQEQIDINKREIDKAFEICPNAIIIYVFGNQNGRIRNEDVIAFNALNDAYPFETKSLILVVNCIPSVDERDQNYEGETIVLLRDLLNMKTYRHVCFLNKINKNKNEEKYQIREQLLQAVMNSMPKLHTKQHDIHLQTDDVKELTDQINQMKIKFDRQRQQLQEQFKTVQKQHEQELNKQQQEFQRMKRDMIKEQEIKQKLEKQLSKHQQELDNQRQEFQRMKRDMIKEQEIKQKLEKQLSKHQQELNNQRHEFQRMKQDMIEEQKTKQKSEKKLSEYQQELNENRKEFQRVNQDMIEEQERKQKLQNQLSEHQQELNEHRKEFQRLNQNITEKQEKNDQLQKQLSEHQKRNQFGIGLQSVLLSNPITAIPAALIAGAELLRKSFPHEENEEKKQEKITKRK